MNCWSSFLIAGLFSAINIEETQKRLKMGEAINIKCIRTQNGCWMVS